jgi:VWFA-related protein
MSFPSRPWLHRVAPIAAFAAAFSVTLRSSLQDPPPQQPPPTFRGGTDLVRVDVTVLDRRGNPVTSLTADDFEVRDNGQPQAITSFKLVEATGQAPDDDVSLEIRHPGHAAAEAARDDVRVFLIFWDEYHISPFVSALRAREALTRIVLDAFGATDLVAIMDPLLTIQAIRFSRDRRGLAEQVRKLVGRRGVYYPPRSGIEDAHIMNMRYIERIRNEVSVSAIKAAAVHLATLREGRKSLVVISESLGAPSDRLIDLVHAANDSNTAIYVIDPRGLRVDGRVSGFLESIASGTGGESLTSNDIPKAFSRVVKQASAFYLLGYAMAGTPMDGRFHEIKVRVKGPGLEVRSRAGYWAPRAADVARAKASTDAAVLPPAVESALARLPPRTAPNAVEIWTGTAAGAGGRGRVTVAWTPRDPASDTGGDTRPAPVEVTLTAASASEPIVDRRVDPAGTSFEAPPGSLKMNFTVRDKAGDVIDRAVRVVEVPDASAPALALTTPVVYRVRNVADMRAVMSELPPVYAGRDFTRTDRLMVRFATYRTIEDGRVSATVLSRAGVKLVDLPVAADPARGGYTIDLPLFSIARGEYILSIEARRDGERAEALVAFRVLR